MTSPEFTSVFDHHEDAVRLGRLRAAVIDDVFFLLHEYGPQFKKIWGNQLKDGDFARIQEKHRELRHTGGFSGGRSLANELIWKWTEATGKYVGCQFWSAKAKSLFDAEVEAVGGWPITPEVKKCLEDKLQKKSPLRSRKLTHEHVYPIKAMKLWISSVESPDPGSMLEHFDRQCVACVVLESEHPRVPADHQNPWRRYGTAGIILAENPAWSESQRTLIKAAGLLPQG